MANEVKLGSITAVSTNAIRGQGWKIYSPQEHRDQFITTGQALKAAGMPLEELAKAGDFLGLKVEESEGDTLAAFDPKEVNALGPIAKGNLTLIVQNRGEITSSSRLLAGSPMNEAARAGMELVRQSGDLSVVSNQQEEIPLSVLEGVEIVKETSVLEGSDYLNNNPYLLAPADLKKAA